MNHAEAVIPLAAQEALDVDQWRWRADFSINRLAKTGLRGIGRRHICIAGYFFV